MKCPVCVKKGLKSCVTVGYSTSTAMWCPAYYNEDGKYHDHDMNTRSTSYSCSYGHTWSVSSHRSCPSCDFGQDSEEITIHNYEEIKWTAESADIITVSSLGDNSMTIPGIGTNPISFKLQPKEK